MKGQNAYFTVEAALVLPLVTGALIFTTFLFVFQYDRCLLEQDINMLAVFGATAPEDGSGEPEASIQRKASELYKDKYAAWETSVLQITVKGDKVSVTGEGFFNLPLPEWNFLGTQELWKARAYRETRRISPADYIRLYRKIKGGQ